MRDFFRGWKRKAGCVTLLMACVFMAGWLREKDCVELIVLNSQFTFVSVSGACQVVEAGFEKAVAAAGPEFKIDVYLDRGVQNRSRPLSSMTFQTPNAIYISSGGGRSRLCLLPYWPLVIPLTLLSAWLLLSKPGK